MDSMISFIVPVYNNALYIEQCVRSILHQNYRDIELIVVDDGSTDDTGSITDELAGTDARMTVVHTPNAGVSAARNLGMDKANGQYIVFVDADDYVAADYADYMLGLIETDDADFALSKHCFTAKNEPQTKKDTVLKLSPVEATALLLSPVVMVGCWDKIYKKDFLVQNGIVFNQNLFYGEGLDFITNVSQKCNHAVVGERKVYYYRRNNETSVCTVFDINKFYNGEKSLDRIENNLILQEPPVYDMLLLHRCIFNAGALTKIIINKQRKKYKDDVTRWVKFNRRNFKHVLKMKGASLYRKTLICASCIAPGLLAVLEKARRKKIQKNSVEDYREPC